MKKRLLILVFAFVLCPAFMATTHAGDTDDIAEKLNSIDPDSPGNSYVIDQYQFLMDKEIYHDVRKQAINGDGAAQYKLADIYYHGRGVRKNEMVALMWFLISQRNGFNDAGKDVKITEHELAFDRVRLAHELAQRWIDAH